MARAEAYLHTKWHLDLSSCLARTDMGRKLEWAAQKLTITLCFFVKLFTCHIMHCPEQMVSSTAENNYALFSAVYIQPMQGMHRASPVYRHLVKCLTHYHALVFF